MKPDELPRSIEVTAYSGYKADERPIAFAVDGRRHDVCHIIDRWYGLESDTFKVLADDGKIYLLSRDRLQDAWFLTKVMESAGRH